MKKGVLLLGLFFLFLIPFSLAQDSSVSDKGYDCLKTRFNETNCNSLSSEGKIFALLTLGKCKNEVLNDTNYKSNLKYTSEAILALDTIGSSTTDAVNWVWAQNKTPTEVNWFLQIDSSQATSCTISYRGTTNTINIGEDKKIDSNAGTCLGRYTGDYWLQISSTCYNEEFEITCDKDFLTTLLFKSSNDNTIHVSSEATSSQGGGTTTEKINFLCFKNGNNCDYEGTLWATMILDYIGSEQDLSPISFYLTTLSKNYPEYFPEIFLYYLTEENQFENELISSQNPDGSWTSGTNKYYNTALTLLAIPESPTKDKAIAWLEDKQMDTGCWNSNNFVDTAFILYSVWPRGVSLSGDGTITTSDNCVDAGFFCMSGVNCASVGNILSSYDCEGFDKCCDKEQEIETCDSLGGEICNSNQQCSDGTSENTFDLDYGQTCCVDGACEAKAVEEEFTCVSSGGICRIDSCGDNEETSFETCEFGDNCCVTKQDSGQTNYLWLWILIFAILIGLVIFGIIKRDNLREFWFRLKSKLKKSPPSTPGMGRAIGQPFTPANNQRRLMQGRPFSGRPSINRSSRISRPSSKSSNEINDVLKRLKDMGK